MSEEKKGCNFAVVDIKTKEGWKCSECHVVREIFLSPCNCDIEEFNTPKR